jgi:hypothetical protein
MGKLYLIIKGGELLDYAFSEKEAKESADFYGGDIDTINAKRVAEYCGKHGCVTIWQNVDDKRELIMTAPRNWDTSVWTEYGKPVREVIKELEEEG